MAKTVLTRERHPIIVDDADYAAVARVVWRVKKKGNSSARVYRWGWLDGRKHEQSLTEFLMGRRKGFQVDHRDRDPFNNRRKNLRWATVRQQACNRNKRRGCATPYKGVTRNGSGFLARVMVKGRRICLGTFPAAEQAAAAYDEAAKKFYGEFAAPNHN